MRHRLLILPLVASLAGVAALAILARPAAAKQPPAPDAAVAPSFTLPARTGTVCLDSLRGRAVLVDFWASWCGPCQKSFPWLSTMYERYGPKGFTVVAVNLDKDRVAAEAFLERHPAAFPVVFDPSGRTAKAYKVWGMPSSFLISPSGALLYSYAGFNPKHSDEVEGRIRAACPQ
jgi:peroxiredoxin